MAIKADSAVRETQMVVWTPRLWLIEPVSRAPPIPHLYPPPMQVLEVWVVVGGVRGGIGQVFQEGNCFARGGLRSRFSDFAEENQPEAEFNNFTHMCVAS